MKPWSGLTTVAIAALFALAPGVASAEKIVIMNFANYMPENILKDFKAATGIDAELVTTAQNEETMGKMVASNGAGYDVVFVTSPFAEALRKLDLIGDLDHANIPNKANLADEATKLAYDPGNVFTMPYSWGTTGLCYRSDLVSFTPDSWNDLLKPRDELKKKITMLATDRWLLAPGQLVNGYSVNDVSPEALEKVKATLIEAKKNILAYDDVTFYSKLVSGEAVLVHGWDGWCNYGIAENPAIKFIVPKEGSDFFIDVMVVPKASEHKAAAEKFINFILAPENQKWVSESLFYKTPNKMAMGQLPADLLAKYPNLAISSADLLKYEIFRDLGPDLPRVSKTVTEITSSN